MWGKGSLNSPSPTTPLRKNIMTPKIWQLLPQGQRTAIGRLQRVMREGSPKYHYDVLAVAAGVFVDLDMDTNFPFSRKYHPLDSCLIINNDVVNIGLNFNGANGDLYIVPAGTIRQISREEVAAIWFCRITNLDVAAAVTVNTIDVEFWRAPEDADSIARRGLQ